MEYETKMRSISFLDPNGKEIITLDGENAIATSLSLTCEKYYNQNPKYVDVKMFMKVVFGISNNHIRRHGGKAIREHTKYNWYKKHKLD